MVPKIKIIAGKGAGSEFELREDSVTIGREAGNGIVLRDASVSRSHCEIVRTDDGFVISDLGSLNGTLVNGTNADKTHLSRGDEIVVGDFRLRFSTGAGIADSTGVRIDRTEFRIPRDSVQIRIEEVFGTLARDLTALLRIAARINAIRDPEELAAELLDLTAEVVPAEQGAFLGVDDEGEIVSSIGFNKADPDSAATVSRSIVRVVASEQKVVLLNTGADDPQVRPESVMSAGTVSILSAPLVLVGKTVGVFYFASRRAAIDEGHLKFVSAVAGFAAPAIENARLLSMLADENRILREEAFGSEMLGESPPMMRVREIIGKVAPAGTTVLITGESGTGKELAARAIHLASPRAEGPFVAVNCATLTETLLESELFGHEKGAFTGAVAQKKGKIEIASGGTLFLDEIGELGITLQARLLRVLQEREFERVGGTRPIRADIRLIAATNRDLQAEISAGRFREDLFYRLNVVRLTMPPLRERAEDVIPLAQHFALTFAAEANRRIRGISAAAQRKLAGYHFPGNVRELRNAIERAVVLGSDDWIAPEDLPEDIADSGSTNAVVEKDSSYHEAVRETKRELIVRALEKSRGSYVEAARLLDVHPNYLHRLIRNLDLKGELE